MNFQISTTNFQILRGQIEDIFNWTAPEDRFNRIMLCLEEFFDDMKEEDE